MKPLRFYILCGDATYNRGDRGNLMSQIDMLRETFPGCEIMFETYRPEVDKDWYLPAKAVRRKLPLTWDQFKAMKAADIIIWGGGALLTDNASQAKIPYFAILIVLIKLILRKPIMIWAQGIIIDTKPGKFFARLPLRLADKITVRDQGSYEAVKRVNPRLAVELTADPAVLAQGGSAEEGRVILNQEGVPADGKPLMAIACTFCSLRYRPNTLIPWELAYRLGMKREHDPERLNKLIKKLADLADELVKQFNANVIFLPTYPAPWEDDIKIFEKVREQTTNKSRIFILKQDTYPPRSYLAIWHHLSATVSIPMHHGIFSVINNVPCVNIYYEEKGKQFFERIHATDQLMSLSEFMETDGAQKVVKILSYVLANWKEIGEKTRREIAIVQRDAKKNVTILSELVNKLQ